MEPTFILKRAIYRQQITTVFVQFFLTFEQAAPSLMYRQQCSLNCITVILHSINLVQFRILENYLFATSRHFAAPQQFVFPAHVGHTHAIPNVVNRIHGRTHIQQGKAIILVDQTAIIVIDNISHILATPVHNPIVAIKWQLITGNNQLFFFFKD